MAGCDPTLVALLVRCARQDPRNATLAAVNARQFVELAVRRHGEWRSRAALLDGALISSTRWEACWLQPTMEP
jgi:hypothetical protein